MSVKGNVLRVFLIFSLIISAVAVANVSTVSSDPDLPRIYVDPPVSVAAPGENFTISVVVADITANESLYVWEFEMSFNSTILNVTSVMQGPFLKTVSNNTYSPKPVINNWKGTVAASEAFLPTFPPQGATGSGLLVNITFHVIDEGESPLHFYYTALRGYKGNMYPIDHTVVDGFFAYPLLRDIAITSVKPSLTSVSAGEPVTINVTVENQGEIEEIFDVTSPSKPSISLLCDSTEIETKTINNLTQGGSKTLSFSWDTKDVAEGNHTITAVASRLMGETDTADNTYTNVVVTVTPSSTFPAQLFIVIIAVIAVAAVCAAVLLYTRRRKPTKESVIPSSSFLYTPMNRDSLKVLERIMKGKFGKSC